MPTFPPRNPLGVEVGEVSVDPRYCAHKLHKLRDSRQYVLANLLATTRRVNWRASSTICKARSRSYIGRAFLHTFVEPCADRMVCAPDAVGRTGRAICRTIGASIQGADRAFAFSRSVASWPVNLFVSRSRSRASSSTAARIATLLGFVKCPPAKTRSPRLKTRPRRPRRR